MHLAQVATYLYGLLLADNAACVHASGTGIEGAGVRVIPCGDLAALVSTANAAVTRSVESAALHDRAVTRIVQSGATVAAVRFGQLFDSDADCCRAVTERSARLLALLHERDGCVEMRVVLAVDPSTMPATPEPMARDTGAGPGRAYLESLRAGEREVPDIRLRDAIGPMIRGEKVESLPKVDGVAIVHLIRREDEVAYRVALATLPGLADAHVTGPCALYSFAEPGT